MNAITTPIGRFEKITFTSQASVAEVESSVHVFVMNDVFDQQFVEDIKEVVDKLDKRLG